MCRAPRGERGGYHGTQPTTTVDWNANWGSTNSSATTPPSSNATVVVITSAPTNTPKPAATPTSTSSSLRNGSTGTAVRTLQQRLKELGYYSGSVDGDFGDGTEQAVIAFQKANGRTRTVWPARRPLPSCTATSRASVLLQFFVGFLRFQYGDRYLASQRHGYAAGLPPPRI